MHDYPIFIFAALLIFGFGLFYRVSERSPVSAAMVFVAVGMIGWFGPRGIASVLYLLIVVNDLGLAGNERILSVIVLTVLLSVFLHGISAVPLSRLYATHASNGGGN